jgi:hypothetical protein
VSAAPRFDTAPGRLRLRRVAFARLTRIREEHVLRLGDEPALSEEVPKTAAMVRIEDLIGTSAENLLRVAVNAELAVRLFEKQAKRVLDLEPFSKLQRFVIQADLDRNAFIEIPEDALESIPELTPEELEALDEKALDEIILKSPKLESAPAITRKEWKALDFLTEIIRKVPLALACWRVQVALGTLRELRASFPGKVLPDKMEILLTAIGRAVSEPPKDSDLANLGRREAILTAWEARTSLNQDERENLAALLGYVREPMSPGSGWASIARLARKYRRTEAE